MAMKIKCFKKTESMAKKIESLGKKMETTSRKYGKQESRASEDYVPNVKERLWSLIDHEFLTTADLGDYLLRSLSVDTLEKVYGWLKQDEMIPSEDTLADEYQLRFDDDGNLVSTDE